MGPPGVARGSVDWGATRAVEAVNTGGREGVADTGRSRLIMCFPVSVLAMQEVPSMGGHGATTREK